MHSNAVLLVHFPVLAHLQSLLLLSVFSDSDCKKIRAIHIYSVKAVMFQDLGW